MFLIGSLLCNTGIAGAIEDARMKIVGDRLTESGRLFSFPNVEPDGDLYGSIAGSILEGRLSPTQAQGNLRKILEEDAAEVRRRGARGVIFVTRKYCEAYDYLFSVYRGEMEGQGIPVLWLSLSGPGDTGDPGSVLEAFADIL